MFTLATTPPTPRSPVGSSARRTLRRTPPSTAVGRSAARDAASSGPSEPLSAPALRSGSKWRKNSVLPTAKVDAEFPRSVSKLHVVAQLECLRGAPAAFSGDELLSEPLVSQEVRAQD